MNGKKWLSPAFPYFAVLFGLFPIIFIWAENKLQVTPAIVLPVFGITFAAVVFVWLLLSLVLRSFDRGSLAATFLFLVFFSYGHIYNFLGGTKIFGIEIGYLKFSVFYALVLIAGLILVLRIKKISRTVAVYLNLIVLILIVFNLVKIINFQVQSSLAKPSSTEESGQVVSQNDDLPDIYYIVLDAYSRADFLSSEYQFDNTEFISALEARGFYVAKCANSNYDGTLASIGSSLNFEYTKDYDIEDSQASQNDPISNGSISNNRLRSELAAYGYKFVTSRGYSAFNDVRDSDIYINVVQDKQLQNSLQRSQFARLYLSTTALRLVFEVYTSNPSEHPNIPPWFELNEDFEFLDSSSFWYYQTLYTFDTLEKIPTYDGNYLVYAHINAPHGPYVFDQDGNFRYAPLSESDPQYYVDTIIYLNKRVLQLVDNLIEASDTPPIIIIQGDHGSHIVKSGFDKHKILSAYYLPKGIDSLYETITPVNTFRLILDEYFGKEYELLPDQIYVKVINDYQIYLSGCEYPETR